MSLKIEIGPTSQTAIELPIDYSSTFGKKQIKSQHRTLGGNLYIYKHSDFIKHHLGVKKGDLVVVETPGGGGYGHADD